MIRTEKGIGLSPEEAFICDLKVDDDTPVHEVPLSTVPGLIEVVSRNIAILDGAHNIVQRAWREGSEVVMDAELERSENQILDTAVVLAELRRIVGDQPPDQTA